MYLLILVVGWLQSGICRSSGKIKLKTIHPSNTTASLSGLHQSSPIRIVEIIIFMWIVQYNPVTFYDFHFNQPGMGSLPSHI